MSTEPDVHMTLATAHRRQATIRIWRDGQSMTGKVIGLSTQAEQIDVSSVNDSASGFRTYVPGPTKLEVEIGPWWARIEVGPNDTIEVLE